MGRNPVNLIFRIELCSRQSFQPDTIESSMSCLCAISILVKMSGRDLRLHLACFPHSLYTRSVGASCGQRSPMRFFYDGSLFHKFHHAVIINRHPASIVLIAVRATIQWLSHAAVPRHIKAMVVSKDDSKSGFYSMCSHILSSKSYFFLLQMSHRHHMQDYPILQRLDQENSSSIVWIYLHNHFDQFTSRWPDLDRNEFFQPSPLGIPKSIKSLWFSVGLFRSSSD
jgi:hypothetical protein